MSIETGTYAFMEVARHYTQSALNIAQAYENEQSKLALDQVLTPARLDNSAGTAQSLAVLGQLRASTSTGFDGSTGERHVQSGRDQP